jgi:hypothetical protein
MDLIYLNYIKSIARMTFITLTDDQWKNVMLLPVNQPATFGFLSMIP